MLDLNTPVTNPTLFRAMNNTEGAQTERDNQIIQEAMRASFLVPVTISPAPENPSGHGQIVLEKETTIGFLSLKGQDDQIYFPVFTDWDALRLWQNVEHQQTLVMPFDDLAKMLLQQRGDVEGIVINPAGKSATFRKPLLEAMLNEKARQENGGIVEQVVKEETEVMLGQPRVYPIQMTQAISNYLKGLRSVKAAYLQLMLKDQEQSYLVVVDFSGDKSPIFQGVATAAKPYLNGMYLDMVPLNSDFGQSATRNIDPFYRRKTFGLF